MRIKVADLVARDRAIYQERMRNLPIVNPRLEVEAVFMKAGSSVT